MSERTDRVLHLLEADEVATWSFVCPTARHVKAKRAVTHTIEFIAGPGDATRSHVAAKAVQHDDGGAGFSRSRLSRNPKARGNLPALGHETLFEIGTHEPVPSVAADCAVAARVAARAASSARAADNDGRAAFAGGGGTPSARCHSLKRFTRY